MSTRMVEAGSTQQGAGAEVARSDERRYSEEEVGAILQRTTGLERRRQLEPPSLSLGEIEAIARESGLDPTLVRQAAKDLENERSAKSSAGWAGAPLKRTSERVVDGELSTEQVERVAADLLEATRGLAPMGGTLSAVGRMVTWSGWTPGGMVTLSVASREGRTTLRADVNSSQVAAGLFGGLIGGLGGGLGSNVAWMLPVLLHLPGLVGALGAAGVVLGAYWLARALYVMRVSGVHQSLEQLADQVEGRLRAAVGPGR